MADDPLLSLDGVVAGYGTLTVLRETSFAVRARRITAIIGPNGAGKSTVFRTIFGLLPLSSGDIRFAGRSIAGLAPRALLDLGIAYVPQGRNLFPQLSVRDNLELAGVVLGDRRLLAERLEGVLARFPMLRERLDRQASTLSGGEQKMLEVGRALLTQPRLLLVDEPSIGLAPKVTAHMFDALVALREAGVTVLMVEQNARSALAVSDDALVMEQGRLALSGPAAGILAEPRVRTLFLGGRLAAEESD